MPSSVFGLQGEQFGDGIKPALGSGAFVLRPAIADDWCGLIGLEPSAVSRLSLGVGEGVLALWLASSGHNASASRNGIQLVGRGGMGVGVDGFGGPATTTRERLDGTGADGMSSRGQQVDMLARAVAGPPIWITTAWWSSLSSNAVATTALPNTSPHSAKPRFEVRIMAPFS